jgi:hypothetical protein
MKISAGQLFKILQKSVSFAIIISPRLTNLLMLFVPKDLLPSSFFARYLGFGGVRLPEFEDDEEESFIFFVVKAFCLGFILQEFEAMYLGIRSRSILI